MHNKFKVIGFDADDTLWVNETYFREVEEHFSELLKIYLPKDQIIDKLLQTEIENLRLYGYGIKGFVLSMIEAANEITQGQLPKDVLSELIRMGKEFLDKPVDLLADVEFVLSELNQRGYKLIVATKGDLLDQERKLMRSGLEQYFHHVEVMSDKKEQNYKKLLAHLDIHSEEFVMIGNSLRSDILPVLNIGASAIHIPFHTTWIHEHVEDFGEHDNFMELTSIKDVLDVLK